jgi:Uma2 family endonuclease
VATPAKKPATYEDLLALPDNVIGQIIDGELVVSPRPAVPHAQAASALLTDLGPPYGRGRGGPGGWWLLFEPELHLDRDVLVPDVAGWRRARVTSLPPEPYLTVAPDWVCEVLSPSTRGVDRVRKLRIYAREHVPHVWLVDPEARTLEVFRLQDSQYLVAATFDGDAPVRAEPFEQIELELGALWLPPSTG